MQIGHAAVAMAITTYGWDPKTAAVIWLAQFLPNFDAIPIRLGWADEDFHCTITHTLLFGVLTSLAFYLFGARYGVFAFISLMAHYAVDLGSSVGLPLFYPFWKRKFTFRLWEHTGSWGWATTKGYYVQKASWIAEGLVVVFVIYRLFVIL
jgi:membrane-bound metal-dependent hydrolase YbcI (DUF457 family)